MQFRNDGSPCELLVSKKKKKRNGESSSTMLKSVKQNIREKDRVNGECNSWESNLLSIDLWKRSRGIDRVAGSLAVAAKERDALKYFPGSWYGSMAHTSPLRSRGNVRRRARFIRSQSAQISGKHYARWKDRDAPLQIHNSSTEETTENVLPCLRAASCFLGIKMSPKTQASIRWKFFTLLLRFPIERDETLTKLAIFDGCAI